MDAIRIIEDEQPKVEEDEFDEDLDDDIEEEDDFETEASQTEDEYSW